MAANEIHKNDIGVQFTVTLLDDTDAVDLSSASTLQLLFKKPGGSLLTKTASFVTDGTDGKIKYTTISGDLDEVGSWKLQAYIVIAANSWHSDYIGFKVHRNID